MRFRGRGAGREESAAGSLTAGRRCLSGPRTGLDTRFHYSLEAVEIVYGVVCEGRSLTQQDKSWKAHIGSLVSNKKGVKTYYCVSIFF